MTVTMVANQKVLFHASAVGFTPSAPPAWALSPPGAGALTPSADGLSAEFVPAATASTVSAIVSISGDDAASASDTVVISPVPVPAAWALTADDPVAQ